jgi:hypothetical protein
MGALEMVRSLGRYCRLWSSLAGGATITNEAQGDTGWRATLKPYKIYTQLHLSIVQNSHVSHGSIDV